MVITKKFNVIVLSTLILSLLIYSKLIKLPQNSLLTVIPEQNISKISGIIISNPIKISENLYSLKLSVKRCCSKENIQSYCKGTTVLLLPAAVIEAFYPEKLYSRNIKKLYNISPIEEGAYINADVKVLENDGKFSFISENLNECVYSIGVIGKLYLLRAKYRIQFKRMMSYWKEAGGLFLALMSGSKEYLDEKVAKAFRFSGLSHILALSGMHLSLISSMAGIIENKSILKKTGLLFKLFILFSFVWFAGISPSLYRAMINCVILCLCTLCYIKRPDSITVLCSTFLIHTATRPCDLFNTGFLLSYGALTGILIFSDYFKMLLNRGVPDFVCNSLCSSLSANIFTAPVCIKLFGFFSPSGIITTIMVSPLITLFLYSGIIAITISWLLPVSAYITDDIMNIIYILILRIIDFWKFIPVINFT